MNPAYPFLSLCWGMKRWMTDDDMTLRGRESKGGCSMLFMCIICSVCIEREREREREKESACIVKVVATVIYFLSSFLFLSFSLSSFVCLLLFRLILYLWPKTMKCPLLRCMECGGCALIVQRVCASNLFVFEEFPKIVRESAVERASFRC